MRFMTTGISLAARTASGEYGEREVAGAAIELHRLRRAHFQPKEILLQARVRREAFQCLPKTAAGLVQIAIAPSCETVLERELRPCRRPQLDARQQLTALVQEEVGEVGIRSRLGQGLPTAQYQGALRLFKLGQMFPDGNTPRLVLALLGIEQVLESDQMRVFRLLDSTRKGAPADGQQS